MTQALDAPLELPRAHEGSRLRFGGWERLWSSGSGSQTGFLAPHMSWREEYVIPYLQTGSGTALPSLLLVESHDYCFIFIHPFSEHLLYASGINKLNAVIDESAALPYLECSLTNRSRLSMLPNMDRTLTWFSRGCQK